ncbi:hypothetical protein [Aureimonas jatrophae]|uniref:Uncharacterized protein n=1 Tax=Aureimonas jatrophae TaxID=1166073 RepID=A0A1H0LMW7_9HYPH|nr:hypothetical protein [Aureimonas jatrophae]MBB3952590.1 hypothetical protein [Aureimonas jatrophae]SDO69386.1 hypothetical protein SAMN05192530_110105 [Aureimonas jatrophae]
MPCRFTALGRVAAALVVLSSAPCVADETRFPPGAETAGQAPPSEIMLRAAPLMQAGKRDEATFWFYAGQLRWRSRLNAHSHQDPTGEPTLFSALFETLGPSVNGWAFGDIPALQRTIDAVLLWDQRYPDPSLDPAVHTQTRAGLTGLRDQIGREAASIRAERASRGLENR